MTRSPSHTISGFPLGEFDPEDEDDSSKSSLQRSTLSSTSPSIGGRDIDDDDEEVDPEESSGLFAMLISIGSMLFASMFMLVLVAVIFR